MLKKMETNYFNFYAGKKKYFCTHSFAKGQ